MICVKGSKGALPPPFLEMYFAKVFFSVILSAEYFYGDIFGKIFFFENIFHKIFFGNLFGEHIFFWNIFGENIFSWKYYIPSENIVFWKYFCEKIWKTLPFGHPGYPFGIITNRLTWNDIQQNWEPTTDSLVCQVWHNGEWTNELTMHESREIYVQINTSAKKS